MSDQENYFNINYPGYSPLEVTLNDPEDFLKVRETLSRIGVASKKEQVLYQSCHILHKKGRYFITHFKELFALDGKEADFQDNDLQRRNTMFYALFQEKKYYCKTTPGLGTCKNYFRGRGVCSFKPNKDNIV